MPTGSSRRRSSQMAQNKRASMREGPLAALFRKTADDREAESEPPKPPEQPSPPRTEPPREPAAESPPAVEPPRVPSPQERLRHAFSSDIPENVMERRPAERDVF